MRTFFILGATAALIACGGRTDDVPKYGLQGPTQGGNAADYPVGDYGYDVGDVVPNIAFLGYEHLDPTTTIDVKAEEVGAVRFSDFYDPNGDLGLSFLYVSVQYVWCGPSNQQEDFTNGGNWTGANTGNAGMALEYASKGVRFMTLIADGPTSSVEATVDDLRNWVTHHEARISEAILPHDALAINVLDAAAPYNMIIDVRTMRIVDVEVGFDSNFSKLASLVN
jgi:hypothetical protein